MDKVLAICFSFAIFAQAIVVRRLVGTWLVPACLFALLWFLCTAVPLICLFTVPVNPWAMFYIFCACSVFSLTALPFPWKKALLAKQMRGPSQNYNSAFIVSCFYGMSAAAVVFMIISIAEQGFSISDIFSDFFAVAGQYIARRYADEITVSVYSQLSFVLMYPGAILGGFIFDSSRSGKNKFVVTLVTFMPSLLALLVQGAKGNLFLVLTFFWGGILARKLDSGDFTLVRHFNFVKTGIYVTIIGALVIVSFLSRGLYDENDSNVVIHGLLRYFVSYSSAHMYGFSDWFSHIIGSGSVMDYAQDSDTNGFYTFMALFKAAGSQKVVPMGTYDEYFYYGEYLMSNIYTWYRGLITDFGIGGSLAFMFLFGFVLHIAFYRLLGAGKRPFAVSLFVHSIGFFYSSYLISLLIWGSAYASFFVVAGVLILNRRLVSRDNADATLMPSTE
jgi:oligosaccharide repeat unit polymerase